MMEILTWVITLFLAGYAMIRSKEYGAMSSGVTYITVGVAALLALIFKHDSSLYIDVTQLLNEWWILETFIFLNIVTGYSFYARSRLRKPN